MNKFVVMRLSLLLAAMASEAGAVSPPPATAHSIGRLADASSGGAPASICDRAASARDRQSPAAANLKAQCESLGGRVPEPAPSGPPGLEELMTKGEAMASANPLAADLRERQPTDALRQGVDIGLAVTAGDTAWGPGKQRILDALSLPQQEGFKLAVSLLMDQNRNAELAQIGFGIAEADGSVTAWRAREADPRFKLGFDIASGLFGNPALGSKGSTAIGPGAMKIRDSLSVPAQRGFNTAVQFHLSRRY